MAGEVNIELQQAREALAKHRNSEAEGLFGVTDWSIKDYELAEKIRLLEAGCEYVEGHAMSKPCNECGVRERLSEEISYRIKNAERSTYGGRTKNYIESMKIALAAAELSESFWQRDVVDWLLPK